MDGKIPVKKNWIYLTVLIYPLWSFYLSIKHFRDSQAKNLFWLFCIFLGMIHIYFPDDIIDVYDGYRYARTLIELHNEPVSLENFTASFYKDGEFLDIYQPVLTYILSIITGNPRWLFLIFAIVFGFFYSRNIWLILEKFPKKTGIVLLLFTLYYALICPVWEINGVRMWTAFHVFAFGALHYLYYNEKPKLIWCFSSILIHLSFFIPVTILIAYLLMPKSLKYYLAFYVVSIFVNEVGVEQIRLFFISISPSFLTSSINAYVNEDYSQKLIEVQSSYNFYIEWSRMIVKWLVAVVLCTACIWGEKIIKTRKEMLHLMCFTLFLCALSNLLSLVIILSGSRFIALSHFFAFFSMILFYIHYLQSDYRQKGVSILFRTTAILLILPIIVVLRMGCDYYGFSLLLNPLAVLFVEDNQPVIQFVKSFL